MLIPAYRWQPVPDKFRVSELGYHFALDYAVIRGVIDRHRAEVQAYADTDVFSDDSFMGWLHACHLEIGRLIETHDVSNWNRVEEVAANLSDFQSSSYAQRKDFLWWTQPYRESLDIDILSKDEIRAVRNFKGTRPEDFIALMKSMGIDALLYWNVYEGRSVPRRENLFSIVVFEEKNIDIIDILQD